MSELNLEVLELIERRRRQILVHSYIYYELDMNLISDAQWSEWAKELYDLQRAYPRESRKAVLYKEFRKFDYSTGCSLNYRQDWVFRAANILIRYNEKEN